MKKKHTSVAIPIPLFNKVKERIKDTGFTSVSSYVIYVLREVISEQKEKEPFTKKDEEKVKGKLRSLGYIAWKCPEYLF